MRREEEDGEKKRWGKGADPAWGGGRRGQVKGERGETRERGGVCL